MARLHDSHGVRVSMHAHKRSKTKTKRRIGERRGRAGEDELWYGPPPLRSIHYLIPEAVATQLPGFDGPHFIANMHFYCMFVGLMVRPLGLFSSLLSVETVVVGSGFRKGLLVRVFLRMMCFRKSIFSPDHV